MAEEPEDVGGTFMAAYERPPDLFKINRGKLSAKDALEFLEENTKRHPEDTPFDKGVKGFRKRTSIQVGIVIMVVAALSAALTSLGSPFIGIGVGIIAGVTWSYFKDLLIKTHAVGYVIGQQHILFEGDTFLKAFWDKSKDRFSKAQKIALADKYVLSDMRAVATTSASEKGQVVKLKIECQFEDEDGSPLLIHYAYGEAPFDKMKDAEYRKSIEQKLLGKAATALIDMGVDAQTVAETMHYHETEDRDDS